MSLSWHSDNCWGIYDRSGMEGCSSHRTEGERRRPWVGKKARPGWSWQENKCKGLAGPDQASTGQLVSSLGLTTFGCLTEGQLGYPGPYLSLWVSWWGLTRLPWHMGEGPVAQVVEATCTKAGSRTQGDLPR